MRNDAKAIEQYRLALKKNDKFALPYNGLGNIAYWAGQYPQAISYYDQATNKDSKFAVAYSNRGNAKLAIGDKEGASVDYERAISLDDKLANPYLGRGKILALKGKWKDALIDFDIAVNLDNENSDAYFFRGIARQSNFVGGSIDDFSSAVQLNPSYTDAYAARAAAYAGMQEYSKAFADLDKALGIDPTSRFALLQRLAIHLGMLDYDAAISDCNRLTGSGLESVFYIVCGSALAAKGDVAGAASNFGRIGQIDSPALFHYGKAMLFVLPGNENIPDAIAELNEAIRQGTAMPAMDSAMFVVRASLYAMRGQKGDDDLARQDFERAIQLAPNAANYKARGDFSIRVRDYDKAIHDFKKATDIAPKFADAHRALGEAYVFSGRSDSYDQALKPFDAAIANAPRATDYFYEGEIYRMRVAPNEDSVATDYQMAIDNYTKALELDPHLIEALWGRALAHQSLNENSAALGDFSEAVKADPKDIAALDWRARFYESIGDYSNAVADIDTAIKIAGASSILFERKGQIYLESGDADSAVKNFDLALNAGPANDWPDHFNRGTAYLHLEQYMRAIQDFTETLRLNPKFFLALHQRGNVYFMMQNYSRAIADYQRIFQFNPRDAEAALMTYIVQKRLGDSRAEKQLQTFAEDAGSTAEPDALIELFLRRHTADDVLAVPKDVLSACTKSYFIGEWHLLQNAQDAAKVSFEEAIKTCAKNDPWYAGAKVELRLLTSAWYRVWAALWGRIYAWTGPAASPS